MGNGYLPVQGLGLNSQPFNFSGMLSDFSLAAHLAILDGLAFHGNPVQDFTGSLKRLGDGMEGNLEIRNFLA